MLKTSQKLHKRPIMYIEGSKYWVGKEIPERSPNKDLSILGTHSIKKGKKDCGGSVQGSVQNCFTFSLKTLNIWYQDKKGDVPAQMKHLVLCYYA